MRTAPLLAIFIVLVAVAASVRVLAGEVEHFRFEVDTGFRLRSGLTRACGFDVYRRIHGTFDNTLFRDAAGVITREIDTNPAATFMFAAPSLGTALTFETPAVLVTDYNGDGTATATVTGLQVFIHVSGQPPLHLEVGRQVFNAAVIDHTQEGVPVIVFIGDAILEEGRFDDGFTHAICVALTRP